MRSSAGILVAGLLLACTGCVERFLTVQSNPPGALVYMNDIEVGRTPLTKRFTWYGTYEVEVRKEGYQTLRTATPVIAPWWQWMPFDLGAELFPAMLDDHHTLTYALKPLSNQQVDPQAMVRRGEQLQTQLESSRLPHPTTQPARHRATTKPARK
ncbi:MAG TPA: PEGA domain-containing protein [Tepidisphaeraceae bacterium]|nr:PEGA domain-containing protein [Tepidisphaeraceae bacterium]